MLALAAAASGFAYQAVGGPPLWNTSDYQPLTVLVPWLVAAVVYEVVNGLFPLATESGERPVLGFLPLGTGNSFLRDFTDQGAEHTIEALARGSRRACDVVRLVHSGGVLHYINLLSIGFVADVNGHAQAHDLPPDVAEQFAAFDVAREAPPDTGDASGTWKPPGFDDDSSTRASSPSGFCVG